MKTDNSPIHLDSGRDLAEGPPDNSSEPIVVALRGLCAIASDSSLDLPGRTTQLLRLGCACFGADAGFLVRHGEDGAVAEASHGSLGEMDARLPFRPGEAGLAARHEAPLLIDGEIYGTIVFGTRGEGPIQPSEAERELVGLMAVWLAAEIQRSRAEKALRASEARFAGIVSISVDAVISVDEGQNIILFNEGAEEIFGYRAEEVLGQPLELLIPPRFRRKHREHLDAFGSGEEPARRMGERGKIHGQRQDGEEFPAEASISKLEVNGERIYSVVLRDVSAQADYEDTLEREALELGRSNRELEAFASVASHDLQEPLRKIRAFGDRLRVEAGDRLEDQNRVYLERMLGAAERMSDLIGDLLAYARVTSRGSPFERVDLTALVREVTADLEIPLNESGGRIDVATLPAVEADPLQMRLLFQNLLGNALKYRREGVPPVVDVSGTIQQDPRPGVEIQVRDNGIGFDEKYRDRIFEVFQRLHGRGQYDGTGIGLAICRKIVEHHGGVISASAEPGLGATFLVTIPMPAQSRAEGRG